MLMGISSTTAQTRLWESDIIISQAMKFEYVK
jgi:hypothetical protein